MAIYEEEDGIGDDYDEKGGDTGTWDGVGEVSKIPTWADSRHPLVQAMLDILGASTEPKDDFLLVDTSMDKVREFIQLVGPAAVGKFIPRRITVDNGTIRIKLISDGVGRVFAAPLPVLTSNEIVAMSIPASALYNYRTNQDGEHVLVMRNGESWSDYDPFMISDGMYVMQLVHSPLQEESVDIGKMFLRIIDVDKIPDNTVQISGGVNTDLETAVQTYGIDTQQVQSSIMYSDFHQEIIGLNVAAEIAIPLLIYPLRLENSSIVNEALAFQNYERSMAKEDLEIFYAAKYDKSLVDTGVVVSILDNIPRIVEKFSLIVPMPVQWQNKSVSNDNLSAAAEPSLKYRIETNPELILGTLPVAKQNSFDTVISAFEARTLLVVLDKHYHWSKLRNTSSDELDVNYLPDKGDQAMSVEINDEKGNFLAKVQLSRLGNKVNVRLAEVSTNPNLSEPLDKFMSLCIETRAHAKRRTEIAAKKQSKLKGSKFSKS